MIPVKIISKVEIDVIKEDVIMALIKNEILRANPELTVRSVAFERKLNPQRMEAVVDAYLTGATNVVPLEEAVTIEAEPVVEQEEEAVTVADIFG
jgi:hypothetical protein